MKRFVLALLGITLATVLIGAAVAAQPEVIEGFVLDELQLISQESLPHWTPRWTGPIHAATILALLAEVGHPNLMKDFNGDGVIDELDTIELADNFGLGIMKTETNVGTNDARLVIGLARYVAEQYPGEFVLKIYDASFPQEYHAETGNEFDPGAIAGIYMELMGEPSLDAYKVELESLEGVIVGLEEDPDRNNTYLSGRSLLFEETPAGDTPVDFAWSAEDRWEPGTQGQVLETIGRMDDRFYVEFRGAWTPVEILLALSPWDRPGISDTPYPCPPDSIAYDVMTTTTPNGAVEVEECVEREGDVDKYTWTVTNIDYLVDGCGICMFAVPNPGLPILDHDEPSGVVFSPSPGALRWFAHLGSCGILPGDSGVFSVSFPAPTVDVPVPGAVGGCIPPGPCALSTIEVNGIRTTGPAVLEDCPDLVVTIDDVSCVYEPKAGAPMTTYVLTVWTTVTNIGGLPVTVATAVELEGLGPFAGIVDGQPAPPLDAGHSHPVTLQITVTSDDPPCPLDFVVTADALDDVLECDENNAVFDSTCCTGPSDEIGACCLPTGACIDVPESECFAVGGLFQGVGTDCATTDCSDPGECPDLIVEILNTDCDCGYGATQMAEYEYSLTARVTNIGGAPSPATSAVMSPGGDSAAVPALASGASHIVHLSYTFESGRKCEDVTGTVVVDVTIVPGECDGNNNTDSEPVDCG
jgi:hypothetical protein